METFMPAVFVKESKLEERVFANRAFLWEDALFLLGMFFAFTFRNQPKEYKVGRLKGVQI